MNKEALEKLNNANSNKIQQSSMSLSEIDIIKQVVNKAIKSMALSPDQDKKEISKDEFRNTYRIWSGFVKFIRSQIQSKQRLVDTKYIGCFYEKDGKIVYLVSQDYFEAGKFKNKKQPEFDKQQEIIKGFKDNNLFSQINEQAIALVCNLSTALVQRVLTDFFSALIELSRTTRHEVILDFKVGNLHLKRNGELLFESKAETDANIKNRNRDNETIRDDVSIIDTASAMLSQIGRGGGPISIRSDFMENLSVRTPGTLSTYSKSNHSVRAHSTEANSIRKNQKMNQTAENWNRFRTNGATSGNNNRLQSLPNNESGTEYQSIDSQKQIPFPFLQAFIERRTGQRFSKKVKFNQSEDQSKILGHIIDQINTKQENKDTVRANKLDKEQREVQMLGDRLKLDQQKFKNDKLRKKLDFLQANEAMLLEKRMQNKMEQEQKLNDRLNYFPFTHGDTIEQQRQMIKDLQKQELIEQYQRKAEAKSLSQSRPFRVSNLENISENNNNNTSLILPSSTGVTFAKALNNYPYKVKQTQNMELTMNRAWLRYEDELRQKEEHKKKLAENFYHSIEKDQKQIEMENFKRIQNQKTTRKELIDQMEHRKMMENFNNQQEKVFVKTSFGPEQNELLVSMLDEIQKEKKFVTKNDLEDLITSKKTKQDIDTINEHSVDKKTINGLQQTFMEEQKRIIEIEKQKKLKNKNEWISQAKMNEKAKKVENLFQ
ncbi:UNKNOWN [Stylonychia lemnae]|uniref:CCDC81 HU domain-containing protein n=1 Tax=Stylonychia lemnae TaxID=5949 RepID=A0A077ZUX9_STYLE|nr:UNKNOWN [Stylonychia lemnae]|eukprot:CDW72251.1 UNKNOWN [Stylonychia lemnae]